MDRLINSLIKILKAGLVYFLIVFGSGFILGPIRVLFIVPRMGERLAELLELPLMLGITVLAARLVVIKFALAANSYRLAVGLLALALTVSCELLFVLRLRGLTLAEYIASRDPVSSSAYYLALIVFALAPLLISRPQPVVDSIHS